MATISLRLTDEDTNLFKSYAAINNVSLSEMIRNAVFERIEDEYDLKAFNDAMDNFKKNPITYTHTEVRGLLDLD